MGWLDDLIRFSIANLCDNFRAKLGLVQHNQGHYCSVAERSPWARLWVCSFQHIFSFSAQNDPMRKVVLKLAGLKIRKLKHREAKQFSQDHTANEG